MDQTRWLIVFAVGVMMIFTLAVLQRMFPGDDSGTVMRVAAGAAVKTAPVAVREFQGQEDIKAYLSRERTVAPIPAALLESPDQEKMKAQWGNFGVMSRAAVKAYRLSELDRQGKPRPGGMEDAP
jgi:hypothetical protein